MSDYNYNKFEASLAKRRAMRIAEQGTEHREPLKTFTEISEMLGVPPTKLQALFRQHKGPRPKIHKPGSPRYWSPSEVVRWWNGIATSAEIPVQAIRVKPAAVPAKKKTSGFAVGVSPDSYQWISTTAQVLGKSKQRFVDEIVHDYIKNLLAEPRVTA